MFSAQSSIKGCLLTGLHVNENLASFALPPFEEGDCGNKPDRCGLGSSKPCRCAGHNSPEHGFYRVMKIALTLTQCPVEKGTFSISVDHDFEC